MIDVKFSNSSICYKTKKTEVKLSFEELPVCYTGIDNFIVKSEAIDRLYNALSNDLEFNKWEIIFHCAALIQHLYPDINWGWREQIMNFKIEEAQRNAYEEYIKTVAPLKSHESGLDDWWNKYNAWENAFVNLKTADVESAVIKSIIIPIRHL